MHIVYLVQWNECTDCRVIKIARKYHRHQVTKSDGIYSHPLSVRHKSAFGRVEHNHEVIKYKEEMKKWTSARKEIKASGGKVRKYRKHIMIASPLSIFMLLAFLSVIPGTSISDWNGDPLGDIWCGEKCVVEYMICSEEYKITVVGVPVYLEPPDRAKLSRIEDDKGNIVSKGFVVPLGGCVKHKAIIYKNIEDTVKYSIRAGEVDIDPILFSSVIKKKTDSTLYKKGKRGQEKTYKISSGSVDYDLGKGKHNLIIGGETNVKDSDGLWKKRSNAKSIVNSVKMEYIKNDNNYEISIVDANETYIKFKLMNLNKKYKNSTFTWCKLNGNCLKMIFNKVHNEVELYLDNVFGYNYTYGGNSTIIQISDVSTGIIADVYLYDGSYWNGRTYTRINISDVPILKTIEDATFCNYWFSSTGSIDTDATIERIKNQVWTESNTCAEISGYATDNTTTDKTWSTVVVNNWGCLNVTKVVNADYQDGNSYASFSFEDTDNTFNGCGFFSDGSGNVIGDVFSAYRYANDRENSSNTPYLNVTYVSFNELNITNPTTSSPDSVSTGDNITVSFTYTNGGNNITTGVSMENVTIGGNSCNIVDSMSCVGTSNVCSVYTNQSSCEYVGCNWDFGSDGTDVIGESGRANVSDSLVWTWIDFKETYGYTPVVIATPVSHTNCPGTCSGTSAGNGGYYPIPLVDGVNKTGFNFSMCIDSGNVACGTGMSTETFDYFVFDVNESDNWTWIEVGTTDTVVTDGGYTEESFRNTMSGTPSIWTQAQTYSQNGNIGAHAWIDDGSLSSSAFSYIGCVHQAPGSGTSVDVCESGQPSETFGYVAIDISAQNFSTEFQSNVLSVSSSAWTTISSQYDDSVYTNPRFMVTQNDDNGAQDPEYAWARDIDTTSPDIRYCEEDAGNVCNSHTSENVVWFALENGTLRVNATSPVAGSCSGTENTCNNYTSSPSCTNSTGCDWNNTQEFEYVSGKGWQVNVTVPTGLTGFQDLYLNATYSGNTRNDTQTNAIDYGGAVNTCSCSSLQAGTAINCSEGCSITEDCVMDGNIATINTGDVFVTGNITNVSNYTISSGCNLTFARGTNFSYASN